MLRSRFSLPCFLLSLLILFFIPRASQASLLDYSGTLRIELGGQVPPVVMTGAETGVSVSSGGGHFAVAASVFGTEFAMPGTPPIELDVTNGLGAFSGTGGGAMALFGTLLSGSDIFPLNVIGAGGPVDPVRPTGCQGRFDCANTANTGTSGNRVVGARWTSGRATATGSGDPVQRTGYDLRDAEHEGRVQFVTPIRIETYSDSGSTPTSSRAAFATLTLEFVPEPGTLLLLVSGSIGLAVLARKKKL